MMKRTANLLVLGVVFTALGCQSKPAAPVPVDKTNKTPTSPNSKGGQGETGPSPFDSSSSQGTGGIGGNQGVTSGQTLGPTDIKIVLKDGKTKIITWDLAKGQSVVDPSLASTLSIK